MVKFLVSVLFFIPFYGWAQQGVEILIHGKVLADSTSVEGINIFNLVNEKTTTTNKIGEFSILAKVDDLLVLTAVNLEIKRKLIEEEDLKSEVIIIQMIPKTIALKEVIVNENSHINAVNLGIIPNSIKKYTPAERKLKTAGDFKPIHLLNLLGGSLAVDPIINAINGKTKRLKKELEIERKEALMFKLEALFENIYYSEKLHIPNHLIKAFQYYLIEDIIFTDVLKTKDMTNIILKMNDLALKYNQFMSCLNEN